MPRFAEADAYLERVYLERWRSTKMMSTSRARAVMHAEPIDAPDDGAHPGATVIVVKYADNLADVVDREALERAEELESEHVQSLLGHEELNTGEHVLIVPADGSMQFSTRLLTTPPSIAELVGLLGDIACGLADITDQGGVYGPLALDHVLLTTSKDGHDIACIPPVWWAWRHGPHASSAQAWSCPTPGGDPSVRAAWSLGAIAWHALTGAPPTSVRSNPHLRAKLPARIPHSLAHEVEELLALPPSDVPIDLRLLAQRLRTLAGDLEESNVYIAPPMLLGTPVPAGEQLRPQDSALPVPPPKPTPKPAIPRPKPTFGLTEQAEEQRAAQATPADASEPTSKARTPSTAAGPDEEPELLVDPEKVRARPPDARDDAQQPNAALTIGLIVALALVLSLLIAYLLGLLA
ncbi:MAG: hypothetical protein EA397_19235 [Deltaproteobacteria bacterium]|nr:MAG: hypothetical protein EA397_19235 [Deltaproteobacteria bacterium]